MKKIISLAFAALIIPQLVFAAWWNPKNWFDGASQIQTAEKIIEKPIEKIVEVEKPVEKIVTKTIVVDNPTQVTQIAELIKQKEVMQKEIDELNKRISNQTDYMRASLQNLKSECEASLNRFEKTCVESITKLGSGCYGGYVPPSSNYSPVRCKITSSPPDYLGQSISQLSCN